MEKGGAYMRWYKTVHFIHGMLLIILLLTGMFLYMASTRTFFNQIGIPLVYIHLIVSVIYIMFVLYSIRRITRYLLRRPLGKKVNFWINSIGFTLWVLSGIIMYFQAYMPVFLRGSAVIVHDWVTFLFIPWLIVHSLGHLFQWHIRWPHWWTRHEPLPEVIAENTFERRDFLKMFGLSIVFLTIGSWFKWLTPILTARGGEEKTRGYFRIYNVTSDYPLYEDEGWTLTIDGQVSKADSITMYDFPRFPETTIVDDFHCVTGWSVRNVEFKGIKIKDLFDQLNIKPEGKFVTAYSGDGVYYDSFLTRQLLDEEAMIVYEMDGEPLKPAQGYPCRLYHPNMYGYKSVKWLDRLEFTNERAIGYWQQRGNYDLDGYL